MRWFSFSQQGSSLRRRCCSPLSPHWRMWWPGLRLRWWGRPSLSRQSPLCPGVPGSAAYRPPVSRWRSLGRRRLEGRTPAWTPDTCRSTSPSRPPSSSLSCRSPSASCPPVWLPAPLGRTPECPGWGWSCCCPSPAPESWWAWTSPSRLRSGQSPRRSSGGASPCTPCFASSPACGGSSPARFGRTGAGSQATGFWWASACPGKASWWQGEAGRRWGTTS